MNMRDYLTLHVETHLSKGTAVARKYIDVIEPICNLISMLTSSSAYKESAVQ